MFRTTVVPTESQLNGLINFKSVETKETKQREGFGSKIEVDVTVLCINCLPNLITRDVEELRMFEYSFCSHAQLLNNARLKASQKMESAQVVPPYVTPSMQPTTSLPAIISNTYTLPTSIGINPQPASQPPFSSAFPQINFGQPMTQTSQPFQTSTSYMPAASTNPPPVNISSFITPSTFQQSMPFSQPQPQQAASQTTIYGTGMFPATTTAPNSLSSAWNTTTTVTTPHVAPQPTVAYPSTHVGVAQPQYIPQPGYMFPPRYYPYSDPYMYMRPPMPYSPYDYSYLYRDYDFLDSSKESLNLQKLLMQRQAAQALWHRYGIDPSLPLARSLLSDIEKDDVISRKSRDGSTDFRSSNVDGLKEAVIQVVPTLAGIKDGKQQILLNIEETPENRAYIPKIFNPNSEISFTITSRDASLNKSYMASIAQDITDEAIPENLLNQSINIPRLSRDLPKPILTNKLVSRKKSILDMDLSDYQIVPQIDRHIAEDSVGRRRVTFQDETDTALNKSFQRDSGDTSHLEDFRPSPTIELSSLNKSLSKISQASTDTRTRGGRIGGSLNTFTETNRENVTVNESASNFKWTPSWFLSKLIGGLTTDDAIEDTERIKPVEPTEPDDSTSSIGGDCRVTLVRDGYYTRPSISELNNITKNGHCFVNNFVVGRYNVGKVMFHGETDVYGINLDKVVFIKEYEIEVYRDDDSSMVKPPLGSGLNKPATLTLFNVYPQDADGQPLRNFDADSLKDFEVYLRRKADELNAKFLDYHPDTGSFSFTVEHFTKYSLTMSEAQNVNLSKSNCLPSPRKTSSQVTALYSHPRGSIHDKENHMFRSYPETSCAISSIRQMMVLRNSDIVSRFCHHFCPSEPYYREFAVIFHKAFEFCAINYSNPIIVKNDSDLATPKEIVIRNQDVNFYTLNHSFSSNFDFNKSTDVNVLFNSLVDVVSFDPSIDEISVSCCRFSDCRKVLDAYTKASTCPVFHLIKSLWLPEQTFTLGEPDNYCIKTKKSFLIWLSDTYQAVARQESSQHVAKGDIFDGVISLLSANLIEDAIALLNKTNNHRIATVLSTSYAASYNKSDMRVQLDKWLSNGQYKYMDVAYIKLCMLIGGIFVIELDDDVIIHACSRFEWVRSYGLFVLFSDSSDSLKDGFTMYTEHFQEFSTYVSPPFSYKRDPKYYDLVYHIINYFCNDCIEHPIMFETYTYTLNPVDYSLGWHVYMIFKTISNVASPIESTLSNNYAKQLESINHWSYALFVLLFNDHEEVRTKEIMRVISSNINYIDSQYNLLQRLKISSSLLSLSKARYDFYIGQIDHSIPNFIHGADIDKAYRLAIRSVIPLMFIEDRGSKLAKFLSQFDSSIVSSTGHYKKNAKVYLDILNTKQMFDHLLVQDDQEVASKVGALLLNIINACPGMEVQNEYQLLARSKIVTDCLSMLKQCKMIKSLKLSDIFSGSLVNPDVLNYFITQNFSEFF